MVLAIGFACHVYVRGRADNLGQPPSSPAGLEAFLFHGMPSVWLQHWLSTDSAIMIWTAVVLHASWFYGPLLLGCLVHIRCGTRGVAQLFGILLALLFASDALFALFPTQPPWMEFDLKRVVDVAYGNAASADMNPVAALPSLHVAVPALLTIYYARHGDALLRRLAPLLGLWTAGVAWSVVYGGEHYIVDALAGVAWAAVVYGAVTVTARTAVRTVAVILSRRQALHLVSS